MRIRQGEQRITAFGERPAGPRSPASAGLRTTDAVGQLLELAEQLSELLVPVQPDTNFRRRLKGELVLEAQGSQGQPVANGLKQHRKGILIGAAAIGSLASVVGVIIACIVRFRHGRTSRIAAF